MIPHFQIKELFAVNYNQKELLTKIINAQKVFEEFNLKSLSEYPDLYVQSDTLLLADVFENLINKCVQIYELDTAHFFIYTWISMAILFKKDRSIIRIIDK